MPSTPKSIPLINFGVQGTNRFQDFDAAYAVGSYFSSPDHLDEFLGDSDAPPDRVSAGFLRTSEGDYRPYAASLDRDVRFRSEEVQAASEALEGAFLVQALGRVRFSTRPREIVFLYPRPVPALPEDRVFDGLPAAREFFEVMTASQKRWTERDRKIIELSEQGKSTQEIGDQVELGPRRVQQILAIERGRNSASIRSNRGEVSPGDVGSRSDSAIVSDRGGTSRRRRKPRSRGGIRRTGGPGQGRRA